MEVFAASLVWVLIALAMGWFATQQGHSFVLGFFTSFLLGAPIAVIIIVVLKPTRRS